MITGVKLKNFRSYRDQAFELEPGVNIIVGPNGSGKTNLLEAIYVAVQGRSFRVGDKELIMHKKPWARIDLVAATSQRAVKLWRSGPIKKQFELAGQQKRRLSSKDKLPQVLFTPDDLRSLGGSPERRRRMLDNLVSKNFEEGAAVVSRFGRALLQRNHLLKQPRPDEDELFVWAVRLGELGGQLADMRAQIVAKLNKDANAIYSELVGKKQRVRFAYQSELGSRAGYGHKLNRRLQSGHDLRVGFTTSGPHRDDLQVKIDGYDSRDTASRGELRTLVLVVKIIEIKITQSRTKSKPLLLLDDVFSELDGARRRQLSQRLSGYQTLITTTDADAVVEHFLKTDYNLIAL